RQQFLTCRWNASHAGKRTTRKQSAGKKARREVLPRARPHDHDQISVTAGAPDEQAIGLLVDLVVSAKGEVRMGKLPLIAAVASVMWALPAFAEDGGNAIPSKPATTLAQLDFCIGPDCQRVYRERERYYDRYDDNWRYRYDDDWRYR